MKGKVNVLFVCGYGVGSSAMSETLVNRGLKNEKINAEVKHTSVGEMESMVDWADIIAISKMLAKGVQIGRSDVHMIEVVNIMDGNGIARQIAAIVDQFYPDARMK